MAEKTIEKFLTRAVQLYEQEQEEPFGSPLLGPYVRRWDRWVRSMSVEHVGIDLFFKRKRILYMCLHCGMMREKRKECFEWEKRSFQRFVSILEKRKAR